MDTTKYLKRLQGINNDFVKFSQNLTYNHDYNLHTAISYVHEFCSIIAYFHSRSNQEVILDIISDSREIHRLSPFIKRVQDWPRGYAGDFETIEYIINSEVSNLNGIGYYLEYYALNCPIAQQHRNKLKHQYSLIKNQILRNSNSKILSIGAGSSRDIFYNIELIANSNVEFCLMDIDSDALAFSKHLLSSISSKINLVSGNILKQIKRINDKYDLIIIGGLFDYLGDRQVIFILKELIKHNLNSRSTLFFTNISDFNPYRYWIEYFGKWFLIHRKKENILNLCESAGIEENSVDIIKDPTGLTYLVSINT